MRGTILCWVNDNAHGRAALRAAADLGDRLNLRLVLAHVWLAFGAFLVACVLGACSRPPAGGPDVADRHIADSAEALTVALIAWSGSPCAAM